MNEMPKLQANQRAQTINKLLGKGYLDLYKHNGSLLYMLKDPSKTKIAKGSDNEEKIVYNIIEEAGNKGIWIRDIRTKSNLVLIQLNKILKKLENKKFIKAVKSVAANKKKVYMVYNLEPDRSITGGAWYQDQDFEAEFVEILNQQCLKFLEKKREDANKWDGGPLDARNIAFASSTEVLKFISDLGISKVKLTVADLEMILNTLIYDGKVEKSVSTDGTNMYRSIKPLLTSSGLLKAPCGVCPVMKNCCDIGDVTPTKCLYMKEWLEF
ncbi:PREDICTED: DNA-directed RNA polymerase III subunit RPC6 isoform X2 [Polistes dominula]|nr:PREDICTED: DNA-directed RNA polymerase III subunit RPC6 isoform X2 [Polistes dominula]